MRISKSIMCTNLGDRRSHDHELTHKYVHKKTKIFGLKIYKFAYNSKNHLACNFEICIQCGCKSVLDASLVLGCPVL